MPGYSGKPLPAKLDLKPGHRLQLRHAPAGFADVLGPLPAECRIVGATAKQVDAIMLFATEGAALRKEFAKAAAILPPAGMLWIVWPKKSAKVATDLTENVVREIGLAAGLVDVKVCAATEVWSGLKFVRRLRDR